jgi:TRAP-type C4-dicarboxylate transport system permease small subunit
LFAGGHVERPHVLVPAAEHHHTIGQRGRRIKRELPVRKYVLLLTNLLMIAFLAVVAYQGTVLATTVIPQKSAALRLSFFWPYMAIPFGAGLMIIQLLLVAARDFVHPEAVVPDDSERAW